MDPRPKPETARPEDDDTPGAGEYYDGLTADRTEGDETLVEPDVPDTEPGAEGDFADESPDDGATGAAPGSRSKPRKRPSAISGKKFRKRDLVRVDDLRPTLANRIHADHPDLPRGARISRQELARYRMLLMEELLQQEHGEFTELDRQVVESIARQDTISENSEEEFDEHRTFGERVSDHLASFGGSWWFLLSFAGVLMVWVSLNLVMGATRAFDPYPFILLNLVLSCIAAIQAPVIMMSQKRQEAKDRLRALGDYRVNLKAELEVRHLHEKLDYLISRQWQRLAEMQQMQLETMHELRDTKKTKKPARGSGTPPADEG